MGEGAGLMLVKPNPSGTSLSVPTSNIPALPIPSQNIGESFFRSIADTASSIPMAKVSKAENAHYSDCNPLSQLVSGGFGSPTFSTTCGESFFHSQSNNSCKDQVEKSTTNGHRDENGRPPAAKYRSMVPSRISMPPQSAPFTIPPGFSLSPLLESPVLIGGLADPSPTTGSFSFPFNSDEKDEKNTKDSVSQPNDNFMFKPDRVASKSEPLSVNDSGMYGFLYQNGHGSVISTQLSSAPLTSVSSFEPVVCPPLSAIKTEAPLELLSSAPSTEPSERPAQSQLTTVYNNAPSFRERSTDGYNWKKYGQKQLKGSEYPRSYYKCTHPNCPVKKQVECSHEGEITEIMYKGEHNHPKPQTTRRASRMLSHSIERPQIYENLSEVTATGRLEPDSGSAELSSSSLVASHGGLALTPDQSLCSPSDEDGEACRVDDDDDDDDEEDDLDSKRRRTEDRKNMLLAAPIRTVREARVVVQTTSEIDILDDGYRWRKYGQKVVKGNLYPRSYYKCTNVGCIVRKHVERSSTDPKSVITTYEGKHNHNVPAARGSSALESSAAAADTGITAPLLETASNVSVSNTNTMSRPMLVEQRDSGVPAVSNGFTMMNQIPISAGMHPNLPLPLNFMSSNFPAMRQFASAELNGQGLGFTLPQQFYQPGLSSSYNEEKPFSRQ